MSTLAELTTEVAEEIGSIDATADQTKIWRFLNRGVRDFLRRTRCYVEVDTFTPGANENYTLDSSVLDVIDMYFTASALDYTLERVTVEELLYMRRAASAVAAPARFYAFTGNNTVLFYPTPGASDELTVVNVPAPTAMSTGTHDPSNTTYGGIPVDYHDALAYYAEWHLASYDDDQSSGQGQRYKDWYMERVGDCKRELVQKGGRLPKARLPRGRRVYPKNDIY